MKTTTPSGFCTAKCQPLNTNEQHTTEDDDYYPNSTDPRSHLKQWIRAP